MTFGDEKQINLALILINIKLNAIKDSMSDEQAFQYEQSIEKSKSIVLSLLDNPLTQEEVDKALKALEI
jgi:hypothetical protein